MLVGKPGINVSTKLAYENLHLDQIQSHPDIDGMISDIENQDLHSLTAKMQNVFEPGIISQYPVIQEIKDLMEANGALKAMMSGSGPTVFEYLMTAVNFGKLRKRFATVIWRKLYLQHRYTIKSKKGEVLMINDFSVDMNEYLPLRDVVFNTLRKAILKGELKPGERLMEIALAERLGVSRTPVRKLCENWNWKVWL